MADWGYRLPIGVAAGVSLLLCLLFTISPDADLVYVFLVTPLALLACLVLLVNAAVRRRGPPEFVDSHSPYCADRYIRGISQE